MDALPPLTPEREAALEALAKRPDSEIDYTDNPKITPERWAEAIPNRYFQRDVAALEKVKV